MIVKHDIPVYNICWLNYAEGGKIGTFYEPESKQELEELCRGLYKEGLEFDLIGHTSNIYFLPSYSVDVMVSTRKVRNVMLTDNYIIADCGVSVKSLSKRMVEEGVKGFEGLIDLPGTVGAAVYGNASCYSCSINALLESFELLMPNGKIVIKNVNDLKLSKRSSSLKRGELKGIILNVVLKKEYGNKDVIKEQSEKNHKTRLETQPGPKDNLGSIYSDSKVRKFSIICIIANCLSKLLLYSLKIAGKSNSYAHKKRKEMYFGIMGSKDLASYVYGWNRYIWKDKKSHGLFWEYHKLHQKLFKNSKFEIEIKGEKAY